MKKGMIKAVVLICCFFAAVTTFGYLSNQNSVNLTTEMCEASYPVISMYYRDYLVGELHGYRDKMDLATMRDSLVPVQSDRTVSVKVELFGSEVDQISYEIRSLDGERLIADRVCDDYKADHDQLRMQLVLENLLEEGQEYQLVFLLQRADETIYYYTRLMQTSDAHLDDYLEFANRFHETSMDKDSAQQLTTYLEPNSSVDNENLNLVTINSSLQEVTWADFVCRQQGDSVLTIAELGDGYAVITLDYIVTATGSGGELEYYNVEEYYRVSYNTEGERCYLHNFERRVNQIFRADGQNFNENYIQLGIRDGQVEYKKSENGQITCFVQEGELWSYNEENGTLYRIFSFRGYEGMDIRENYAAHDIRILSINEGGSVDFAVYGYMNRGVHEGESGISVCHFDSAAATVEELLFVKSDKSYSRLRTDMGDVLYENAEGILFCMMEGSIYRINTADGSERVLAEGLGSESYSVSSDGHLLVWQTDENAAGDITVLDLENERGSTIAADGQKLYPVGFLVDDFVYGVAAADSRSVADGSVPMSYVRIYDADAGEMIKEYHKKNYYMTDISINEYVINLERVRWVDGTYIPAEPDTILNHQGETILDDNVCQIYDDIRQTLVEIRLLAPADHNRANVVTSREVLLEEPRDMSLIAAHPWEGYYTYAKGNGQSFHSKLQDAIAQADEQMGVVVDASLKAVWKRSKRLVCTPLALPENLDVSDMTQAYPEAVAYDLTGCELTQTLYYVSEGIPVVITLEDGSRRLLVGYDSANVWIYNPDTKQTSRETITAAQTQFGAHSSHYTAYLR